MAALRPFGFVPTPTGSDIPWEDPKKRGYMSGFLEFGPREAGGSNQAVWGVEGMQALLQGIVGQVHHAFCPALFRLQFLDVV